MRTWTSALSLIALSLVPAATALGADTTRTVLVPGNFGGLPTAAHSLDQIPLYDGLTPKRGAVSASDLSRYFKFAPLGTKGQGKLTREKTSNARVKILRDRYGV